MLPGGWGRAVRLREVAVAASLDVPRYLRTQDGPAAQLPA